MTEDKVKCDMGIVDRITHYLRNIYDIGEKNNYKCIEVCVLAFVRVCESVKVRACVSTCLCACMYRYIYVRTKYRYIPVLNVISLLNKQVVMSSTLILS